jgi:predicted amidohydrolase
MSCAICYDIWFTETFRLAPLQGHQTIRSRSVSGNGVSETQNHPAAGVDQAKVNAKGGL